MNIEKEKKCSAFTLSASIDKCPQDNQKIKTNENLGEISCLVSSNINEDINVFLEVQLYNKENCRKLNGKIYKSDESFTLKANGTETIDDIPNVRLITRNRWHR